MNGEALEDMPALAPLEFFSLEGEIPYSKPSLLPDTSAWLGEERFADVSMAWKENGLYLGVVVEKPFEEALYPRFFEGDAFELFLDTRDLKTAGFATRFCHQFVFLPQAVQGIQAQEITHFRADESHPYCDADMLQVSAEFEKNSYELQIHIPSQCLHGYDPASFDRIGLTYRIHRFKGKAQHFSLSSQHFSIEQHPRLWASFKLEKS